MSKATVIICAALCLTPLVCLPRDGAAAQGVYVTVEAGAFDRRDTVVSFARPSGLKPGEYALRDGAGRRAHSKAEP